MENIILQRIKEVIEYTGLSDRKFSESVGIPQTTLSSLFQRDSDPSVSLVQAILYSYPNISMPWLLFGNGKMLVTRRGEMLKSARESRGISTQQAAKAIGVNVNYYTRIESGEFHLNDDYKNILIEKFDIDPLEIPEDIYPDQLIGGCENRPLILPPDEWLPKNNELPIPSSNSGYKSETLKIENLTNPTSDQAISYRLVPLLNLDAVGGMHKANLIAENPEYIEKLIPFTDAQDGDVALTISGDSMSPTCPAGSKVLIREVSNWKEYFGFGNIFVILLTDGRRILKEVQKFQEDSKNYILCRSHNDKYPEEELPKSMIQGVWKVVKILNERGW